MREFYGVLRYGPWRDRLKLAGLLALLLGGWLAHGVLAWWLE